MPLEKAHIKNFRNIEEALLTFDNGFNLIIGDNRSGKTSLIEALHFLFSYRSFRTQNLQETISQHASQNFVQGIFINAAGNRIKARVERRRNNTSSVFTCDDSAITKLSNWVKHAPAMLVNSDIHQLISGSPQGRRKLLDWGVFHVEPLFEVSWKTFSRLLKQRNALLKRSPEKEVVTTWDKLFVEAAEEVTRHREMHIAKYTPVICELGKRVLGEEQIKLTYHRGWPEGVSLKETLSLSLARDTKIKNTEYGPHRADISVTIGKGSSRYFSSRGEQKLLGYIMSAAQTILLNQEKDLQCIILCDDLESELDENSSRLLIEMLATLPHQTIVTSITGAGGLYKKIDPHVFHVKHGVFSQNPSL